MKSKEKNKHRHSEKDHVVEQASCRRFSQVKHEPTLARGTSIVDTLTLIAATLAKVADMERLWQWTSLEAMVEHAERLSERAKKHRGSRCDIKRHR